MSAAEPTPPASAERGGAARGLRGANCSRITRDRHDRAGGRVAAEHRRSPARRLRRWRARRRRGAERDLEQVRDAIDGVRALLRILERSDPRRSSAPLRDALSRAADGLRARGCAGPRRRAAPSPAPAPAAEPRGGGSRRRGQAPPAAAPEPARTAPRVPGRRESSGRLWVPGR